MTKQKAPIMTSHESMTSRYRIAKIGFLATLILTFVVLILYCTTDEKLHFSLRMSAILNMTKARTNRPINCESDERWLTYGTANHSVELQRQGRTTMVEFKDMPDPCAKHRRSTIAQDLLCMKPLEFLPDYKNPCYKDGNILRCMPYFHLFGICKSGTTDLFRRLYLHPDIIPNKGVFEKETMFWSWRRYTNKKVGNILVPVTLKHFTDNFKAEVIERAVDEHGYHFKITGHGDPMDIWDRFDDINIPQNNPKDPELLWTTAFLVRKVNPDVKLLLMLRDPIQRLYSTYFHWQLGTTSEDFHRDVANAIPLWNQCLKQFTMRHCIYDKPLKRELKVPIYSSFYLFHLKEWLRAFPREQMLIMRNEDYSKDIKGTLIQIFKFLNVGIPNNTSLQQMENLKHFYETKGKVSAGPMKEETKQLLIELYKEPTKQLGEFLQDKRFAFEDVSFRQSISNRDAL